MSDDVSRETPPAPELVQGVFGVDGAGRAERLHALLSDEGVKRGLIGPRETARLWERHLLNCGVIGEAIKGARTVTDVGSGAGLPGLPLAIARPDLSITLIEPLQRRVDFLVEAVGQLELTNVEVVRARAEEIVGERAFAVVTSRAVAPLDRLMRWCLPLVDVGGEMLAMKGARAVEEIDASEKVWRRLAGARPEVLVAGSALLEQPTTLVRARPASRRRRQV